VVAEFQARTHRDAGRNFCRRPNRRARLIFSPGSRRSGPGGAEIVQAEDLEAIDKPLSLKMTIERPAVTKPVASAVRGASWAAKTRTRSRGRSVLSVFTSTGREQRADGDICRRPG